MATIESTAFLARYMKAEIENGPKLFDWKLQQSPTVYFGWSQPLQDITFYLPVVENLPNANSLFQIRDLILLDANTGIINKLTYTEYTGIEFTNEIVTDIDDEPIEYVDGRKYYYLKLKFKFGVNNNFGKSSKIWNLSWKLQLNTQMVIESSTFGVNNNYNIIINQSSQSFNIEDASFYIGAGSLPYPAIQRVGCLRKGIAAFDNIIPESIVVSKPKIEGASIIECEDSLYDIEVTEDNKGFIYATINVPTNPTNFLRTIEFDISGVSSTTGNIIKYTSVLRQSPNTIAEGVSYPSYYEINYLEQTFELELEWDKDDKIFYNAEFISSFDGISLPSSLEYIDDTMRIPVSVTENPFKEQRNAVLDVQFKTVDGGDLISHVYIQINQNKNVDYGVINTWQTKKIEINFDDSSKQTKQVDVLIGDEIIYSNLVYNTGVNNFIDVTEIINNNMAANVNFELEENDTRVITKVYSAEDQYKRMYVYADGVLIFSAIVYYNYKFDDTEEYSPNKLSLNRNIFNIADPRQLLFSSIYADKDGSILGNYGLHSDGLRLRTQYLGHRAITSKELCMPGGIYHSVIKPTNSVVDDSIVISWQSNNDDDSYQTVDEFKFVCPELHKYAIYYVNMYGGIDFLLGTNASTETVTSKNSSITKYADNNIRTEFGKYNYLKENVISWKIVTDMFYGISKYKTGDLFKPTDYYDVDEQAKLMQHLFQSPKIWVHDLEKDIIYSANLTDTKMTNKTFMTNGNKHFNFTLNLERSQTDVII